MTAAYGAGEPSHATAWSGGVECMIVYSAGQLADRVENGFRSAGEVQSSHLHGFAGVVDTVLRRFALVGGVDQQSRGQVSCGTVGQHLVDVSVPETLQFELLVLGVADETRMRLAPVLAGRPPGEIGLHADGPAFIQLEAGLVAPLVRVRGRGLHPRQRTGTARRPGSYR